MGDYNVYDENKINIDDNQMLRPLPVFRRGGNRNVYSYDENDIITDLHETIYTDLGINEIIIKKNNKYYIYENTLRRGIIGSSIRNFRFVKYIENDEHHNKYLKYKNKYLKLKQLLKL